jgi:putative ABC transport system permease protein
VSFRRQLTRGLRVLFKRSAADQDLSDEVDHYLEQATSYFVASGLSPEEARRAARLELGSRVNIRDQVRESAWENLVLALLADLRYAARRLRHSPGFAATAVITLGLGIGATTAIFSAVNPILFAALPYPGAHRITMISDAGSDGEPIDVTFGTYRELRERSHAFEALAPIKPWQPAMIGRAEPERLVGQRVGAGFFAAVGVTPVLGRDFRADDDRPNGPRVVILSNALWRRRFAGDPGIIGREIDLDDTRFLVIGVMPRDYENVLAPSAEIWAPLQYSSVYGPDSREWGHHLRLVGRVRRGVSVDQAKGELDEIARTPTTDFPRVPWADLHNGLIVSSLQDHVTRGIRPALHAVIAAVMLLLAITCVNVTNLLLARGAQRRGEFAVRAALGAGRGRLIRQLITETTLLALIGGAAGLIVAELGVGTLVALSPPELPRLSAIRLDQAVLAFGTALTVIVGLVVGAIPAMHASRQDLRAEMQGTSRRTAGGSQKTRGWLVMAEVALALVLLVGAGLLLRSIQNVFAVPVGFDSSHLLTMQVQAPPQRHRAESATTRFYSDALDAVRAVPGVGGAAFTALLPLSGDVEVYGVRFESNRQVKDLGAALRYAVMPGYFDVMRIPLRRGRLLDAHDDHSAPRAALINETFARRRFPHRDVLGQRLQFGPEEGDWYTVVGIVGDVKQSSLDVGQPDAIYVPAAQWHWPDTLMSLVVRSRGDAASLTPAVRRAIWSVDKDAPIVRIATMDELVRRSVADRRFALVLFEAFGLVALFLAATGIYGVLAGIVTERTREIGVRSALGASRGEIIGLVVRQGLGFVAVGVGIGVTGAVAASHVIVTLLFGVSPLDPMTYAGVTTLLLCVSAIACGAPAYRASRVDPSTTLRAQ